MRDKLIFLLLRSVSFARFRLRESLFDDTADAVLCLAQLLCVIARETKQLRLKEYNNSRFVSSFIDRKQAGKGKYNSTTRSRRMKKQEAPISIGQFIR